MKKLYMFLLAAIICISFVACKPNTKNAGEFNASNEITVISREDGSGTRGAFVELLKIEQKEANGNKKDLTTKEAIVAPKTDVMLSQVAGNDYSIGYVSVGSLSDKIKAIQVDGIKATPENIKNGSYKVARPFNIATKVEQNEVTKDFIHFILSKEGQEVVAKTYIAVNDKAAAYSGKKPSGKIVVAGSSSVSPIMEKLKEAYTKVNPNATIEIQTSDSSSGMKATTDGVCDIGMASRDLKESEKATLKATQIAIDGIAVVVNNNNPITNLSSEAIKNMFTGKTTTWDDL
ncbi:substrate-binding domain-containing protein [Paludicola sp. MB14-C6]|uniref:substrate-binding domain-containing protein n=1 Tax=Paludihabitans sp. MB14-C6 TaxID=3070656 RepID=UPI0027DB9725|nr:substrate-binding domain-containing protein [Paludicola sp. MB14-C6]WMJ24423.1 substrate-binding domain-containing protein [Paludicola sp. MB14-C6]